MPEQLVNLTENSAKRRSALDLRSKRFDFAAHDGGVGYLVKEALKHCFPGTPRVTEQLEVLSTLIETCGRAGAKSVKVRISTDAKIAWQMPKCVKEAKLVGENPTTIDLEIIFRPSRTSSARSEGGRG